MSIFVLGLALASIGFAQGTYDPCVDPDPEYLKEDFPKDFIWGVATSAYQYEGGWNLSGKGESIMDKWYHKTPINGANGDVSCDGYHKWQEDLQRIKFLKVSHYRFSFSWARLLPTGRLEDGVNPDGVRYYEQILSDLKENGIEPIVTMNHQEIPQKLQDDGGWLNEKSADWFAAYARFCFQRFGSKIKWWLTINQPIFTSFGYFGMFLAPGNPNGEAGRDPYIAVHNIIKAHVKAWHIYDKEFRSSQNGEVGIPIHFDGDFPKTLSPEDITAADNALLFNSGRVLGPLFGPEGDYPNEVRQRLEEIRIAEGTKESRLPKFSEEEKRLNKGACDYVGFNLYGGLLASAPEKNQSINSNIPFLPSSSVKSLVPNPISDLNVVVGSCPSWKLDLVFFANTSWAMRHTLNWVRNRYSNPKILISENGVSDGTGTVNDIERIGFFNGYINSALKALVKDGCNIVGFVAWTLMDDFEWTLGYVGKFGLFHVDFEDPNRQRTAKASAYWYRDLVQSNSMKNLNDGSYYSQIVTSSKKSSFLRRLGSIESKPYAENSASNLGLVLGIGTVTFFVVVIAGVLFVSRQQKKIERHRLFSDPSITTYRSF